MPEEVSASGGRAAASSRSVLCLASPRALGSWTDVMLSRLGYRLLSPARFAELCSEDAALRPDLLPIEGRHPNEAESYVTGEGVTETLPIVLLTRREGPTGQNERVVGAVTRPAGLHDLDRAMQQVFEDSPRSTPCVATTLEALCESVGPRWTGQVLSLSENGCLIRRPEAILLGQRLQLERQALPTR